MHYTLQCLRYIKKIWDDRKRKVLRQFGRASFPPTLLTMLTYSSLVAVDICCLLVTQPVEEEYEEEESEVEFEEESVLSEVLHDRRCIV